MERVAGLLLAAGGGRRIGAPKALLRQGDQLLVERAAGVLREAGCANIVVVLGAGAELVQAEANLGAATIVVNHDWSSGLGSSLRAGLTALAATDAEAALVLLVDAPYVTVEAVRRVAALPYPQALVCATYGSRRGHPMLLGRGHWEGIAELAKGDLDARPYLLSRGDEVVEVGCDGLGTDDHPDTAEFVLWQGASSPGDAGPNTVAPPAGYQSTLNAEQYGAPPTWGDTRVPEQKRGGTQEWASLDVSVSRREPAARGQVRIPEQKRSDDSEDDRFPA